MFRNYVKTAFRNIKRDKLYTTINIAGLTIGIISCILIGLYVFDELSYDRFHTNADRIVRLTMEYSQGADVNRTAVTGTKPGPLFQRTFPSVLAYTRMIRGSGVVAYRDKIFEENKLLYADSSFLKIFTFPLLAGDPVKALDSPDKIIITRSMARKYFGRENPLGESLRIDGEKEFIVSGIAADIPGNSQIKFDFLVSFNNLKASQTEEWFSANYLTYFLLDKQASVRVTEQKLHNYMMDLKEDELDMSGGEYLTYHLEPLREVHLFSDLDGMEPNGDITYVYTLSIIAALVLLIACINYTNLSIAQSSRRIKEMGMRKVLGAHRYQLFQYFIIESTILAGISTVLAFLISYQALPFFNILTGKALTANFLVNPLTLMFLAMLCIIVGLFSGAYPALILSKFKLTRMLKGDSALKVSNGNFGKSLIVFQFVVSVFLIITTVIIRQQIAYIQNKNLGYDKENILVLPIDKQVRPQYYALKEAMKLDPNVIHASAGYDLPTFIRWTNGITATTGSGEINFTTKVIPADLDFLETFEIDLLAGSDFTEADLRELKTQKENKGMKNYFLLNQSAIRELGWTPEEALGRTIQCGMEGIVKGVVKNFHISSLHNEISPLVILLNNEFLRFMFIKINGNDIQGTLKRLEEIWASRVNERPFEYHFLDDDYQNLYQSEQKMAWLISTFTGLAIVLACLGLFGLSAFMAVRRTKEIGIRKVLGASVREIILLLSGNFMVMVGIACLIAIPCSWLFAREWLSGFAYHIDLQVWIFAGGGLTALLIALITVSLQFLRVAVENPVNSLRND